MITLIEALGYQDLGGDWKRTEISVDRAPLEGRERQPGEWPVRKRGRPDSVRVRTSRPWMLPALQQQPQVQPQQVQQVQQVPVPQASQALTQVSVQAHPV